MDHVGKGIIMSENSMTNVERIAVLDAEIARQKQAITEAQTRLEAEKKKSGVGLAFLYGKEK